MTVDSVGLILVKERFVGMRMRIFRDYHDGESATMFFALLEQGTNTRDSERMLRNQNRIRAAGDAAVRRNPSRVAAHHFDYHHAVVRLGCRMQAVNCVGND